MYAVWNPTPLATDTPIPVVLNLVTPACCKVADCVAFRVWMVAIPDTFRVSVSV